MKETTKYVAEDGREFFSIEKCVQRYRFTCMSESLREYGQPYYSMHENESTGGCLNQ